MKLSLRRLPRVADSSHYHPLHPEPPQGISGKKGFWRRRPRVPVGHVPVCVGEEMERFYVRAELLCRPAFAELLSRSAQEYGYDQAGVLHIPCSIPLFRRLLLLEFNGASADPTLEEIFRSLPCEIRPCTTS